MSSEFDVYFRRLRSHLHLNTQAEDSVVRELRTHVEDRLMELENAGLSQGDAKRLLLQRMDRPQALARQFQEAYLRASWHDALTGATAFLLVGALYMTHLWSQPTAVLAVAIAIVAVTLYGLWQGRPSWFYPWAGLALTLLSFCGYFAFVLLERGARLIGEGALDGTSLLGFAGAALYVPLALLILASCILAASRRDWLDASLMLSPSAPVLVWLAVLHENGGLREAGTAMAGADAALGATFLAMAAAAAVFVRVRARTAKLATMIATGVLVLVAISSMYDPELSLATLTLRAMFLAGFLLIPAVLQAIVVRPLKPTTLGD